MKIAITTEGKTLDGALDPRFGRAKRFILYDTDKGTYEVLENEANFNAAQGAGIQAAQNLIDAGVDTLITGHTGPNAFRVLQRAGILVYQSKSCPVAQAIEAFMKGELQKAEDADVGGHWT